MVNKAWKFFLVSLCLKKTKSSINWVFHFSTKMSNKHSKMKNGVGYSCKKVKGGLYSQWPKGSGVTSHHFLWVTRTTIPPFLSWNSKSCSRTKVAIHHVCTYVKCYSRISILSCHPNGFQRHNLFGHLKVFFLEKKSSSILVKIGPSKHLGQGEREYIYPKRVVLKGLSR